MKDSLEHRALSVISEDLSDQLENVQAGAEKLTGKVTPFGMEQLLQEKFKTVSTEYESYLRESQDDLDETDHEILQLEKNLESERIISESLLKEKKSNQEQLSQLSA